MKINEIIKNVPNNIGNHQDKQTDILKCHFEIYNRNSIEEIGNKYGKQPKSIIGS